MDLYKREMEYIPQNHLPLKTFQIAFAKIKGNLR